MVVTRPAGQGRELAKLITQAGGRAIRFPTIEIVPLALRAQAHGQLQHLYASDWLIFISTHAAHYGMRCIRSADIAVDTIKVASIGTATSRALRHLGIDVDLECPAPAGSESLLTTTEMRKVTGLSIVIFRGTGGRELLGKTLRERGAKVEYIECYERRCPGASLSDVPGPEQQAVFVTTSVNGLENLLQMVALQGCDYILDFNLVVFGERQLREARALGWRGNIEAVRETSNLAILHKLREMANL